MKSIYSKMKQGILAISATAIALSFVIAPVAYAETVSDTPDPIKEARTELFKDLKTLKHDFADDKDGLAKKIEERKASYAEQIKILKAARSGEKDKNLDESAQERVQRHVDRIFAHFTEKLERLDRVDAKLTSKVDAHAVLGHDVVPAKSLLSAAEAKELEAKASVEAARITVAAQVNASTTRSVLRDIVESASQSIKEAGIAYKKVVEALRDLPRIQTSTSTNPTN